MYMPVNNCSKDQHRQCRGELTWLALRRDGYASAHVARSRKVRAHHVSGPIKRVHMLLRRSNNTQAGLNETG